MPLMQEGNIEVAGICGLCASGFKARLNKHIALCSLQAHFLIPGVDVSLAGMFNSDLLLRHRPRDTVLSGH